MHLLKFLVTVFVLTIAFTGIYGQGPIFQYWEDLNDSVQGEILNSGQIREEILLIHSSPHVELDEVMYLAILQELSNPDDMTRPFYFHLLSQLCANDLETKYTGYTVHVYNFIDNQPHYFFEYFNHHDSGKKVYNCYYKSMLTGYMEMPWFFPALNSFEKKVKKSIPKERKIILPQIKIFFKSLKEDLAQNEKVDE